MYARNVLRPARCSKIGWRSYRRGLLPQNLHFFYLKVFVRVFVISRIPIVFPNIYWNAKRSRYFALSVKFPKLENVFLFFPFFRFFMTKMRKRWGKSRSIRKTLHYQVRIVSVYICTYIFLLIPGTGHASVCIRASLININSGPASVAGIFLWYTWYALIICARKPSNKMRLNTSRTSKRRVSSFRT